MNLGFLNDLSTFVADTPAAELFISYMVFVTIYGFILFAGVKVARIENGNYGFCALISLGAGLVTMASLVMLSQFGLAGQISSSMIFLGLTFYLLVRVYNTTWGKAALAMLVSIAIPALISLMLQLTAQS